MYETCAKFLKHWTSIAVALRALKSSASSAAAAGEVPLLNDDQRLQVSQLVMVLKPVRVCMGQIAGSKSVSICSTVSEWMTMTESLQPCTKDSGGNDILPSIAKVKLELAASLATVRASLHCNFALEFAQLEACQCNHYL